MRLPQTARELLETARNHARGRLAEEREQRRVPQIAPGTELIGEYQGSGFKEPPYLVRRADGQILQLPRLLFLIASHADGTRSFRELADAVSAQTGRRLSPADVAYADATQGTPITQGI